MVKTQDDSNKNYMGIEQKEQNEDIKAPQEHTKIAISFNKNYTPFIPKNYKILENNKQYGRKNSDNSTEDESSPEKKAKKNKKNKKQKKEKREKKEQFKGEAKDFKIKYKTELCKFFEIDGKCKFGDKCAYAHGVENLRSKVTNTTAYRTKKCTQFFEKGYCPYGNRCQFAHQLKTNIINNPYDKNMSYTKMMDIMSKLENIENIKKLVEKPRLPIFEEICKENNNICEKEQESRLFNDIKKICKEGLYEKIEYK